MFCFAQHMVQGGSRQGTSLLAVPVREALPLWSPSLLTHLPASPHRPDCQLDFCMHLGRTGEVYFVTEVEEEVDGDMSGARPGLSS